MNWIWVFLVATLLQACTIECCIEAERLALLELKTYLNSSTTAGVFKWYDNGDRFNCCAWDMVECNPSGRVYELNLGSMVGRAYNDPHNFLFNVTLLQPFRQLTSLDLSFNYINGLVDKDGSTGLSTLKNLQFLKLDHNHLQAGSFSLGALISIKELSLSMCIWGEPSFQELANLTQLQVLDLSFNAISGSPIEGICHLKNLQELHLRGNNFYGSHLWCLNNMTSLKVLDLSINNFSGELSSLENLTSLEYLDLSDNLFYGRFSLSSLANLSNLKTLILSRNSLKVQTEETLWQPTFQLHLLGLENCSLNQPGGTFPKFLYHQYILSGIDLSHNNLVGTFPTWLLNNNSQLISLYLMNNRLTGYLQFSRYANFSLNELSISSNHFHGTLPDNVGYVFPQMGYLNISGNYLEGHIPISVGHMRKLGVLDLSNNNLSGQLPTPLLRNEKLAFLILSDNSLQGDILPEYMSLPNLSRLKLSNNCFGGTITDALLQSSGYLNYLDISNNKVTGPLLGWIGDLTQLKTLSVSDNFLQGQIPKELCNLSLLNYLDLSRNNFTGLIPSCSNFKSLYYMHLQKNSFTGLIPKELSGCSNLESLDLRDNQLSGSFPEWIHNLSNLTMLLLAGNNLHGRVPKQICELRNLNLLDLARNKLSGEIPTCFWMMSFGMTTIEHYLNRLLFGETIYEDFRNFPYYSIDTEVEFLIKNQYLSYKDGNLHIMSALDLSDNKFTGAIPPELGDMVHVHSLNLSHNFFSGFIPTTFSNLKQIESLDLSFNNLKGRIPSELVVLNFLEVFNVSYNNLTRRIIETGQFSSFDQSSYLGNLGLCGSAVNKSCSPENEVPPTRPSKENGDGDGNGRLDMVDFFWSFSMSCVIMFLATLAILYINPQWREAWFEFVEWHLLWWFSKL